jgi:hypothetical protein
MSAQTFLLQATRLYIYRWRTFYNYILQLPFYLTGMTDSPTTAAAATTPPFVRGFLQLRGKLARYGRAYCFTEAMALGILLTNWIVVHFTFRVGLDSLQSPSAFVERINEIFPLVRNYACL